MTPRKLMDVIIDSAYSVVSDDPRRPAHTMHCARVEFPLRGNSIVREGSHVLATAAGQQPAQNKSSLPSYLYLPVLQPVPRKTSI